MASQKYARCQLVVKGAEGGWCDTIGDSGGETIFGVSRVNNPTWPFWDLVDAYAEQYGRGTPEFIAAVNADKLIYEGAVALFVNKYWAPIRGEELPEDIDLLLYDVSINSGPSRAGRILHHALNTIDPNYGADTKSGTIMDLDISTANNLMASEDGRFAFIHAVLKARLKFYWAIVDRDPSQIKFIKSWVNRLKHIAQLILDEIPEYLMTYKRVQL